MGCICSKGTKANQYVETQHVKEEIKSSKRFSASFRGDGVVVEVDGGANDVTLRLITNQPAHNNVGSTPVSSDEGEKAGNYIKAKQQGHATAEVNAGPVQPRMTRIVSIGEKGAQVVAGWPSWLTAVAGEAISGWVPRKADSFEKLDKIGQGTYSSVYRARDLDANKIVALKKVRFANMDPESVRFMAREILILRRLDHPNVMKLEGIITSRVSGSLYLIFEYMEHDLAGLAATPGIKFTEAQIKCYMQQLLRGLEHCHSRGVLHRDIKGSNLLLDNKGNLKIGDFGLATLFQPIQQQPLTSRVVTLWFRPPELLLGATNYEVAVDLWSTGCILAELFAGKPIMPGRTEVEQLHKIFKLCGSPSEEYWKRSKLPHTTIFKPQHPYRRCVAETFKDFPSSALALLDVLLAIEPEGRGTAFSALQSQFFTTQPLPCDPSTLPKYSPSKEFDAKLRNEENRRRRASGGKGRGHESVKKNSKESKTVPAPDANSELPASIQKQIEQHNPKSNSKKLNPEEDGGSGFPIEPSRGAKLNIYSHSGQSMHPGAFGSSRNMNVNEDETTTARSRAFTSSRTGVELRTQRSYIHLGSSQLSRFSNSIAIGGGSRFVSGEEILTARYHHLDDGESSERSEWSVHIRDRRNLSQKKDEQMTGKESRRGYAPRDNRIHYSGPLLPPGGDLEEMLKEHETQIQHAVRKARFDKTKTKKTHNENRQAESLLHHARNFK